MIACTKCRVESDASNFHNNKARKGGLNAWCKPCVRASCALQREKHGLERKFRNRVNSLRRKYGLSWEAYMDILEGQNFLCSICRCEPTPKNWFCVDHNHTTGKVRGVLCMKCNAGIGQFKENREHLVKAAIYLECHGG